MGERGWFFMYSGASWTLHRKVYHGEVKVSAWFNSMTTIKNLDESLKTDMMYKVYGTVHRQCGGDL